MAPTVKLFLPRPGVPIVQSSRHGMSLKPPLFPAEKMRRFSGFCSWNKPTKSTEKGTTFTCWKYVRAQVDSRAPPPDREEQPYQPHKLYNPHFVRETGRRTYSDD